MSEWEKTTIGQQVTLQRGIDITKAQQRIGNVPVVSSGGISSYHDTVYTKGPGVVLGRKGVVGSVYYVKSDYWPHDTTLWVKDFHGNDPRFVYYFFKHMAPLLAQMDVGSANPTLNRNHVHPIETSWPPLPEQRAIAHILGTLDDKIELNRRMNETLEDMAQAIFKSWFVDFDPVHAKAEGRDTGLPKEIADLFPDSFEETELGEVPKGWRLSNIGSESKTVLGGTPSRNEETYWGGNIPWINSGKANEFRILEPSEFITKKGLDSSATKILPPRTTVIAITGATLGQVSLTEIETCANQSIIGVLGTEALPSEFIYFWTKEHIENLLACQTGGAQQHINKSNVNDLPVLCPRDKVISAFLTLVFPVFDRIKTCCMESLTFAELRDTLLPKLISGKLRANDVKTNQEHIA